MLLVVPCMIQVGLMVSSCLGPPCTVNRHCDLSSLSLEFESLCNLSFHPPLDHEVSGL